MLPASSTSSLAYFPPKYHTLSLDYVEATHTTASSTGNSTQASNGNYDSLYTQPPTKQFVRLAPLLIFLAITSSNAHISAKLASTMLFAMASHMLWPQFSPHQDSSPQTLQLTRNPTFTSHLTLTPICLTSPLTHTQPHHHSHLMDVPPTPPAQISPSAHYLPCFLSILILRMFNKLSRPMPAHIYRIMNARNLAAPTKPTHPPPS